MRNSTSPEFKAKVVCAVVREDKTTISHVAAAFFPASCGQIQAGR